MKLTIGWWNTHLSPPGKSNPPNDEHFIEVCEYLVELGKSSKIDLIALGEINTADASRLRPILAQAGFEVLSIEEPESRLLFKMAVVYRPKRLSISAANFEIDVIAGKKSKIALRLNALLPDRQPMTFFVIHWTSRILESADTQVRSHLAASLRRKVNALFDLEPKSKIIVLGDFNDEPYDLSIARYLEASREIQRVGANPRLLYNPFWRQLSPLGHYSAKTSPAANTGSFYYRNGHVHRWHVFDQILLSSSFVGGSAWHLDEENTYIVDGSRGFPKDIGRGNHFDHYPVIASLERVGNNESI